VNDATGRVFNALADPNRRYVLEALASRETATATELAAELRSPGRRSRSISPHSTKPGSSKAGAKEGKRSMS